MQTILACVSGLGAQIRAEPAVKALESLTQLGAFVQWQTPLGQLRYQFGFYFIRSILPQISRSG